MVQRPPPSDTAWITRLDAPVGVGLDGPLAGLRFAAKDNIDVAGVPTTAACPAFSYRPQRDATVVRRLLDGGALLLGKTNLDQFACGLNGTRSPYGEVPNAFDARYVSGGSSSGSAYVVASGEVDGRHGARDEQARGLRDVERREVHLAHCLKRVSMRRSGF